VKLKEGFTLIELLVVIAIISLLSSIILSNLNEVRAKARDAVRISDLRQIRIALELFFDDNRTYPSLPGAGGSSNSFPASPLGINWETLRSLLSSYIDLPSDPIGGISGGTPGIDGAFKYWYIPTGDLQDYDLIAVFEKDHPLRCEEKGYLRHLSGNIWCPPFPGNDLASRRLYADH